MVIIMSIVKFMKSLHMPESNINQDCIDREINYYQNELEKLGFNTKCEEGFINLTLTKTMGANKGNIFVCVRLDATGYKDISISLQRDNFIYRLPNFYSTPKSLFAAIKELDRPETKVA